MSRPERTCDYLAQELRKVADIASATNAEKYRAFAARAEKGEFDDYAEPSDPAHICPITQLHAELTAAGFVKFAKRVASGEFDATIAESDEWAASPQGQEAARYMTPEMRKMFGL